MSTRAAVGGAEVAIAIENGAPQGGWDGPGATSVAHGCAVLGADGDLGDCVAEDRLQGIPADTRTGFQSDPGLAARLGSMSGVDEDTDLGRGRIVGDGELDQGGRLPPGGAAPDSLGERGQLVGHLVEHLVDDRTRRSVEPAEQPPPRLVEGGLEDQVAVFGGPELGLRGDLGAQCGLAPDPGDVQMLQDPHVIGNPGQGLHPVERNLPRCQPLPKIGSVGCATHGPGQCPGRLDADVEARRDPLGHRPTAVGARYLTGIQHLEDLHVVGFETGPGGAGSGQLLFQLVVGESLPLHTSNIRSPCDRFRRLVRWIFRRWLARPSPRPRSPGANSRRTCRHPRPPAPAPLPGNPPPLRPSVSGPVGRSRCRRR